MIGAIAHWAKLEDVVEARLKKLAASFPLMYLRLFDTKSAGNFLPAQPSDFLVWQPERPGIFLEVKYSAQAESLRSVFSNAVSANQMASARLADRAGQKYSLLFYSAPAAMFELWDGAYCARRRSLGKPLELAQRVVSNSLERIIDIELLGLSEEKLRRLAAKEAKK